MPFALLALLAAGAWMLSSSRASDRRLTRNFWLREFVVSDNWPHLLTWPSPAQADAIAIGARMIQAVRDEASRRRGQDSPAHVTSGYRGPALNVRAGGSDSSDHAHGRAADFWIEGWTDERLIRVVYDLHQAGALDIDGYQLDQVITYTDTGHLHLGWRPASEARGQFKIAYRTNAGERAYQWWTP